MDKLSESIKNILLAGVGAAAIVAEKTADAAEVLVKKGQETVDSGKELNKELKHKAEEMKKKEEETEEKTDYKSFVASLSDEEKEALKKELEGDSKED
jgi:polyhydroxyalkanoate synthesis regulator phasin